MLEKVIHSAEQVFMQVLDQGSDHELFIASYLQGHFDLVISQVNEQEHNVLSSLSQLMDASLHQAFSANELEEGDQEKVRVLWQQILLLE